MSCSGEISSINFDELWDREIKIKAIDVLEDILDKGLPKDGARLFDPKDYVAAYTACYNMCIQPAPRNYTSRLYLRHRETMQNYHKNKTLPALRQTISNLHFSTITSNSYGTSATVFLEELQRRWNNHQIFSKWLAKLFHYVDRYYVKHQGLPTLTEQGLQVFKEEVYDKIKAQITLAVLEMIHDERHRGILIDATLLTDTVKLYEAMSKGQLDDAYGNDLESKFIESTQSYYAKKRDSWIENDAMSEYLLKVESVFEEERNRVCKYLNVASETKLLRALEEELLEKVEIILLRRENSGCRALLANDKHEDLVRPFRLFSRFETGIPPFATIVQNYIIDVGLECVHKQQMRMRTGHKYKNKYDSDFVTDLCAIHVKYLTLIKTVFEGHSSFQKALRNAFVAIVNTNITHISNAELLSSYCDRLLKKRGEKLSYSEIEEQLERTLQLFIYLTDKDLFAEIYRNQLAKRLLSPCSASHDLEKLMVTMLKMQCGTQFTSRIEGMLRDITDGQEEHQHEFVRLLQLRKRSIPLQFTAQVLTNGIWPAHKAPYVGLVPSVMSDCTLVFSDWYETQHPTRKLTWNFSLGNAIVKATFGAKQYDLYLSTLQAVILNEFNGGHTLRLAEVAKKIEVEENILKLVLHSLSCGKVQVLIKIPQGKHISNTDRFVSNSNFYSKLRKIRIPIASLDSHHNMKRINEDRSIAIEAAVVRIMKSRKTLDHKRLVAETLSQLAFFQPNPKDVKYGIESLIERDYLKRNPKNSAIYHVSYETLYFPFCLTVLSSVFIPFFSHSVAMLLKQVASSRVGT